MQQVVLEPSGLKALFKEVLPSHKSLLSFGKAKPWRPIAHAAYPRTRKCHYGSSEPFQDVWDYALILRMRLGITKQS
jgi:hypothetical protein